MHCRSTTENGKACTTISLVPRMTWTKTQLVARIHFTTHDMAWIAYLVDRDLADDLVAVLLLQRRQLLLLDGHQLGQRVLDLFPA